MKILILQKIVTLQIIKLNKFVVVIYKKLTLHF